MQKPTHFHDYLARQLADRGSKKALAEATGIKPSTISGWLQDKPQPPLDKAVAVARHYGISLDYLATGEDYMAGKDPRVVEICRRLLRLEGDADFLGMMEAVINERTAQKGAAASAMRDAEEEDAESSSRG